MKILFLLVLTAGILSYVSSLQVSSDEFNKIYLDDCINCGANISGDANLVIEGGGLTPLGPGEQFTFGM
jgi:hypothetical protein